jgi:prepilin-type N-terminal cleavage/methylation domain-containing protein
MIPRAHSQRGFTLVEVVLALTIFALMGGILYGAFALGHKAVDKSEKSYERNQQLRSTVEFLGSYVRSSYPYRTSPQNPAIFFDGTENSLTFVSAFSLALGGRGMAKIRIQHGAEESNGGTLTLEEEIPARLGGDGGDGGHRHSLALLDGVKDFRLAYLDPQGDDEKWEDRWDGGERRMLPRAVRLSYRSNEGKEVRWVFPVMMAVLGP